MAKAAEKTRIAGLTREQQAEDKKAKTAAKQSLTAAKKSATKKRKTEVLENALQTVNQG